ncbi:MAG TPA: hypothetical protein VG674_05705 [Amycolatopsis sp.]|nr:hypothetical protein [Amycolatopsis sp.]
MFNVLRGFITFGIVQRREPRVHRHDSPAESDQLGGDPVSFFGRDPDVQVPAVLGGLGVRNGLEPHGRPVALWIDEVACAFVSLLVNVAQRCASERTQQSRVVRIDADFEVP